MALGIRRTRSGGFSKLMSTSLMVLALAIQPMYGLVAGQVASATSGTILHVAKSNGSDSNECTQAAPCKTIQHAINIAHSGYTIQVRGGTYAESILINKNIHLVGNGKDSTFIRPTAGNGIEIHGVVGSNGAGENTVSNLTVNGANASGHGFNIWNSTGISLWRVGVQNNKKSGINIASSEAVVTDVTTSNNTWHAINVDQSNDTSLSHGWMKLSGGNSFNENAGVPLIYQDDINVSNLQIDNAGLYGIRDNYTRKGDRAYFYATPIPANVGLFKASTPIVSGSSVNTKSGFSLKWDQVDGADRYRIAIAHPDGSTAKWEPSRTAAWNPARWSFDLHKNDIKDTSDRSGYFGERDEGVYSYTVEARNGSNGVWSAITVPTTLVYDKTSPEVDILTPSGMINTEKPFVVSGTFEDDRSNVTRLHVYVQANGKESKAFIVPQDQLNKISGTFNYEFTEADIAKLADQVELGDGDNFSIKAWAYDSANNWSNDTINLTSDNSGPTVSTPKLYKEGNQVVVVKAGDKVAVEVAASDTISGVSELRASVYTCPGGSNRRILVETNKMMTHIGGDIYEIADIEIPAFYYDRNGILTDISTDGGNCVVVYAYDNAGNETKAQTLYFNVDNVPPVVDIVSASNGYVSGHESWKNARNVEVEIRDKNVGVTKLYRSDGTEVAEYEGSRFGVSRGLAEGAYYLIHTDKVGNESIKRNFVISNKKPSILNIERLNTDGVTFMNSDSSVVSFEASNGDSLMATVDQVMIRGWVYSEAATNNRGAAAFSDQVIEGSVGGYSRDLAVLLGDKFVHGAKFVIMLQAKNTADVRDQHLFVVEVDAQAPGAPVITGGVGRNTSTTRTISGVAEPNATIRVTVDGQAEETTADAAGNWRVTFSGLSVGDLTVSAVAIDAAGNQSVAGVRDFEVLPGIAGGLLSQDSASPASPVGPAGAPVVTFFTQDSGDTQVDNTDVLGAQTQRENSNPATQTAVVDSTPEGWKIFGLLWYWWLLILAALAGIWWFIAAARRRNEEDTV